MFELTFKRVWLGIMAAAFALVIAVNTRAGDETAAIKPSSSVSTAQDDLLESVLTIVEDKCAFAGCHTGANAPKNLDMSETMFVASLVGVKSSDTPWLRVKPGDPANSYMIKKLRGAPDIKGDRMPRGGKPLSEQEIATIEAWIKSLPPGTKAQAPKLKFARAFPGWTIGNLQTPETIETGAFLYRIAHKFKAPINAGFDQFFGLDGGAYMMTQYAFAITNNLTGSLERSGFNATFEFGAKWRFLREKTDGSMPISAAIYAGVDWLTLKGIPNPANPTGGNLKRTAGERFAYFAQLPLSKQIGSRISLLAVPGILIHGNVAATNEDPLVTIGVAGRFAFSQKYAWFVELVPIVSGDETATTVGGAYLSNGKQVFFDTFTTGLEIKVGGHVFHVFVTNSAGNTTNQYMSGGNFDFDGDPRNFRLGFNIYRILSYPF